MSDKWKKHRIGKLLGNSVFIELPPGLSGHDEEAIINASASYLEQSFKNHEFLEALREITKEH